MTISNSRREFLTPEGSFLPPKVHMTISNSRREFLAFPCWGKEISLRSITFGGPLREYLNRVKQIFSNPAMVDEVSTYSARIWRLLAKKVKKLFLNGKDPRLPMGLFSFDQSKFLKTVTVSFIAFSTPFAMDSQLETKVLVPDHAILFMKPVMELESASPEPPQLNTVPKS